MKVDLMQKLNGELTRCLCCGSLELTPYAVLKAGRQLPAQTVVDYASSSRGVKVHVFLNYSGVLQEDLFFDFFPSHLVCTRTTRNLSGETILLVETGVNLTGIELGGIPGDDYFYHVENPRIYSRLAIPIDVKRGADMVEGSEFDVVAGNRWADPDTASERIGASPYQPFPAILLSNFASKHGLVHGSLSQRVFFHNYLTGHDQAGAFLDIRSSFKAIAYRELQPEESISDVWYLGRTDRANNFEEMFADYTDVLREHLPPLWGATDINRHSLVWGSWNDGIFRDVDQDRLLRNAEFVADNFPTVEWLQLDDGYARHSDEVKTAHGLGMPYEGAQGVAEYKFPNGFRDFTGKVRQKGLRPAIWIGGSIPRTAEIAQEHPDWGIDYSYRLPNCMILDVSKPEVRKYMTDALDFFFPAGGFEGMKHDFWSYVFEDSHDLLANKARSGYEWRDWWLKEIRRRLPDNAYFQTGCDIVMGNPFLAQYFTNYRYGIDIGSGNWEFVKTNFLWGAACFGLRIGDLFVPNSDSVGLFPGLTDREALLCINYCLISRSMVEISGWLYKADRDDQRFKWLQKAVCCPDNGRDVFFADYNYRATDKPPEVWYLKTPHFSTLSEVAGLPLRTVAVFNLEDKEREFNISFASLGLTEGRYLVKDVWSDACSVEQAIQCTLPPHGSTLLAVSRTGTPQLLDADLKVESIISSAGAMNIKFGCSGKLEMLLSHKPVNLASTEVNDCFKVCCDIHQDKELTIKF